MIINPSVRASGVVFASFFAALAFAQTQTPPVKTVPTSPATKPAPVVLPAGVAARVNGKDITFDALAVQLRAWQGSPLVQQAVRDAVVAQEAKKYNVSVTPAELSAEVYQFKQDQVDRARSNGGVMMTWREIAARDGIADAYLADYVKNQILSRKAYKKFLEAKVKGLDEQRKVAIIAVTNLTTEAPKPGDVPDTSEAKAKRDADAKAKIAGILADIKANKISFADAAKQYSADKGQDGQGSAARGGELPWLPRTLPNGNPVGDPAFVDAVFGLEKPGDVTPAPVPISNGYLLVKLLKKGSDATPAEKAAYFKSQVDGQMQNPQGLQQWVAYVVQTAKVDYAAATMATPQIKKPVGATPPKPAAPKKP